MEIELKHRRGSLRIPGDESQGWSITTYYLLLEKSHLPKSVTLTFEGGQPNTVTGNTQVFSGTGSYATLAWEWGETTYCVLHYLVSDQTGFWHVALLHLPDENRKTWVQILFVAPDAKYLLNANVKFTELIGEIGVAGNDFNVQRLNEGKNHLIVTGPVAFIGAERLRGQGHVTINYELTPQ